MSVAVNQRVLCSIKNDNPFIDECCRLLEHLVDLELEKSDGDIDFDFIDECTYAIIWLKEGIGAEELDYNKSAECLKLRSARKKSIKQLSRIFLIAAAVLAVTLSANAAVAGLTGINIIENIASSISAERNKEESTTTEITTAESTAQAFEETTKVQSFSPPASKESPTKAAERSEPEISMKPAETQTTSAQEKKEGSTVNMKETNDNYGERVVDFSLVFIRSQFKSTYFVGESFSSKGIIAQAEFSNSNKISVPIDQCSVSGFNSDTAGICTVTVSYGGFSQSFTVEIIEEQ